MTQWRDTGTYAVSDWFYEISVIDVRFPRKRGKPGSRVKFSLSPSDHAKLEDMAIEAARA